MIVSQCSIISSKDSCSLIDFAILLISTCKKSFKSNKGLNFVKGESYTIFPAVGIVGVELFEVEHNSGESFMTIKGIITKFFVIFRYANIQFCCKR